ncbi:T-cell activation Rho GTPase-activating protein [Solea senegalensis]|uniref:T-cell activation Rho GTPase-activating protein n=3 Tax=Solea senegalensis TaxID=28829 RepID=A0AAV6RTB9_SOLSE|nr:T cell activation RhoGTPase activating protein b isoform X1 [Solea senegalensis]KAG7508758.1 T-cell activation Rho GTPase-activating protein [Solea senegalensis]
MDAVGYGIAATRRGSYDDSLRPHFKHLAQRRRSAPSLVFGKALGMPWSPIREEASCWVSVEQSPFVFGLSCENGELLLDECVQVTDHTKTRERHLFLFNKAIIFAKLKSTASYRLKHRVNLEDIWLYGFEDDAEEEEGTIGDIDLRVTVVLAWALSFCLVCFRSPEVKERWLDTLHRKIKDANARAGCAFSPPDVLMKVLSGSIATKTLTGGGMEQVIEFPLDGDAKLAGLSKELNNEEEKLTHPTEKKWGQVVRRFRKGSSFIYKASRTEADTKTQLFGQPLCKICTDECSLPKPVTEMLVLLRKRGPTTEGVFRKPCNNKNMKDVREQLNSGVEVDLVGQPVVLLIGLLKSFLKELPGSLLVSELYDKWIAALGNEDAQQRALEIKKVVDKLPVHNKLLLQHLVCVLHHILESADINKMDAYNLAVCIAPSLLQLDNSPLVEQKDKMMKVTELTQVLIEHCEILGENIPNLLDTDEDSLSSQHHDSAYDSTDPDGDGEAGEGSSPTREECGSSSSLCTTTTTSWASDPYFKLKPPYNRRCSEPIILISPNLEGMHGGHARSHEDFSMETRDFEEQPLRKQISDDSFLLEGRARPRSVLSYPLPYTTGHRVKDCSSSSLESTASNQSEGSVFTSSPLGSPVCPRRANNTNQPSVAAKSQQDIARPIADEKRRSQSMRVANKVLMRTRSLGAFSRSSMKRDSQKENSFPCETLQEDSQSEADTPTELLHKTQPLSVIEVFKQVDSRLPCRPPSYEQAVQNAGLPPQYGAMTVQDAIVRRSRPSSVNYDLHPSTHCIDSFPQDKSVPFRQRAMSESVSRGHREVLSRRCSQPVFEEFSYAKESYV